MLDKTVPLLSRLSTGKRKSCHHAQKEIPNLMKLNLRPLKKLGNFYDQLRYLLPNQLCRPFFIIVVAALCFCRRHLHQQLTHFPSSFVLRCKFCLLKLQQRELLRKIKAGAEADIKPRCTQTKSEYYIHCAIAPMWKRI